MKVEAINRDIQRSDSFQERSMGLAVGSEAFVFNVLRKDLYSDPVGSLIREYTVNAQDEHRKHNKTEVPIHIQVPNTFIPELHIRDYAGGLTEEQVFNFFGNYGASDKRDSNVAVGFFGLGCKSAFAYTDSYIVKSYKDGKCYTFNIYIDETEIGKTAKIAEENTTEANGIKIIVPVQSKDIWAFQKKVISTVSHFKTKPVITGLAEAPNFEKKVPTIKGNDWAFFGSGSPTVVMGEIPYPLDSYKLGELEAWEQNLVNSDIVLNVNIGDVQVTASREALQMSPKTIETIRGKLREIKDAMVIETEKAFKDAKNLIEAKQLYHSVVQSGAGYSRIIESSDVAIKWNGQEITNNVIRFDKPLGYAMLHRVTTYSVNWKGKIKAGSDYRIVCRKDSNIFFDDTDQKANGYIRRARTLVDEGAKEIVIIHTTDAADLKKILGVAPSKLPSFNAIVPQLPSSKAGYGTGTDLGKRAKHTAKVFVLDVAKLSHYYKAASEVWELKEIENPKGLYVPIDRFQPCDVPRIYNLDSILSLLTSLKNAGITLNVPIYGIKKGGSTEGLVRLDKYVDFKVKNNAELLEKKKIQDSYVACRNRLRDVSRLELVKLPKQSVAKEYAESFKQIAKSYNEIVKSKATDVFRFTSVTVDKDESVETLSEKFLERYPLLGLVDTYSYGKSEVTEYIAETERCA